MTHQTFDAFKLNGPYKVVFDVGSFQGDFAYACHLAWPEAHIHCFEPLLPNPDQTPAARSEAFVGWVTWHQVALGDHTGRIAMYQCGFLPSSSVLPMGELHKEAFPYTRENEPVYVQMHVLADYDDEVEGQALLKIDVQGYELEVLRGAGETLDLFSAVALEVSHQPLYEGVPSFLEIDRFLAEMGFQHAWRLDELHHPKTQALLQTDELWLR